MRPQGKPVPPRAGEDPPLAATNGIGTTRPPDSPTAGSPNASVSGSHAAPGTTQPRDPGTVQRPPAPADYGGQSIRDVCKGSFFERNICLDQRCEEARFRATPECVAVLDRKRKVQSQ